MPPPPQPRVGSASQQAVTGGLHLFVGPDRYRKLERIAAIAQALAVNLLDRHEVSARELAPATLGVLIREQPAASRLRLVILDDAHRLDQACLKVLAQHAQALEHTACVILLTEGELEANHPLAALSEQAWVERFAALTPHDVGRWIRRYLASHQKDASAVVIQELTQTAGADLAKIRSLLDQLISWVGQRQELTPDDLRTFLPAPSVSGNFALVNAIGRRDLHAALEALHEELAGGREPVEILGMLVWQLQRWVTIARGVQAGLTREQLATQLGIRPGHLERLLRELAGRSTESLRVALEQCWELDCAAKSGRAPTLRVELERLMVQLCLPRSVGGSFNRSAALRQ